MNTAGFVKVRDLSAQLSNERDVGSHISENYDSEMAARLRLEKQLEEERVTSILFSKNLFQFQQTFWKQILIW